MLLHKNNNYNNNDNDDNTNDATDTTNTDINNNTKTKTNTNSEEIKKVRAEELLALADTIKILNDDDALDLFSNNHNSSD